KLPTPGSRLRTWTVRDNYKRFMAAEAEPERKALKYVTYNTTLPMSVRIQAQMKLSAMPSCTRMTMVKNRCVMTGKGRSVLSKFKMCRYVFKEMAKAGEIPGVKRATW
ncbi:mitochondrial 37S ribosomal protein uS14m, partial [Kockiozyma suomiensis]|uniref:mitochondrial 37S ribosomal protein uS14m n=1 Tax=Kockiozyma suomiensis TaxID=1337062 RepID=UPI003343F6E2